MRQRRPSAVRVLARRTGSISLLAARGLALGHRGGRRRTRRLARRSRPGRALHLHRRRRSRRGATASSTARSGSTQALADAARALAAGARGAVVAGCTRIRRASPTTIRRGRHPQDEPWPRLSRRARGGGRPGTRARLRALRARVLRRGRGSLATEIGASRLLAPYYGWSTIVWANLIGLVLASLSVGYWLGGKIADRRPERARARADRARARRCWVAMIPFVGRPFLDVCRRAGSTRSPPVR